ncbi:MAG: mobilization protein, partial [Pseudomonadota bacterium]
QLNYVLVLNQLRGDDFGQLERSGQLARAQQLGAQVVTIKKLHDAAVQKIDAHNSSFWAAKSNAPSAEVPGLGMMDRQRLKMWLGHAFGEIKKGAF